MCMHLNKFIYVATKFLYPCVCKIVFPCLPIVNPNIDGKKAGLTASRTQLERGCTHFVCGSRSLRGKAGGEQCAKPPCRARAPCSPGRDPRPVR